MTQLCPLLGHSCFRWYLPFLPCLHPCPHPFPYPHPHPHPCSLPHWSGTELRLSGLSTIAEKHSSSAANGRRKTYNSEIIYLYSFTVKKQTSSNCNQFQDPNTFKHMR